MNLDTNNYTSNYLNINNPKWENVRSNSYYVIDIKHNFNDDNFHSETNINTCPICFNVIWRDLDRFECQKCKKQICEKCIKKIHHYAFLNNQNVKCPCCRNVIKDIQNRHYFRSNRVAPSNNIISIYNNNFIFGFFLNRWVRVVLIIAVLLLFMIFLLAVIHSI